jgi:hypothetical protein
VKKAPTACCNTHGILLLEFLDHGARAVQTTAALLHSTVALEDSHLDETFCLNKKRSFSIVMHIHNTV